jgi:glucose-6-phosphate dehydrogenase assembly protein OpcA
LSANLQPVTLGGPRTANIAFLPAELDALWQSTADAEGRETVTRACALTLLIYTESEEGAREVSELVGALTLQNPCRALILVVQPNESPAGLSATISAVCQLPAPGVKQVCCEHVTLVARGERVHDLDKVVLPLMVSGLPVGLWWRAGCQLHFNYFGKILRYIDRVYVDSEWHAHPETDLRALAKAIQEASSPAAITDMNWARITPWRELAAACFDPVERRPYLDAINLVRIEYRARGTDSPDCRAQALFFTAWLAERLGWKPAGIAVNEDGEGKREFNFKGRQGDIQVQLSPGQSGPKCSSGFLSIEMETAGDAPAKFSLVCGAKSRSVATRVEIPGHPLHESTAHLEVFDEVGLLNEELKFSTRDRGYERVLAMVTSMTT